MLAQHRSNKWVFAALLLVACDRVCFSEEIGTDTEPAMLGDLDLSETQARDSVQWLATYAMQQLPQSYQGDKDWGTQKRVWAGVRTKLDGFKLKTNRRYKDVRHGRWIRYEIQLPEPNSSGAAATRIQRVTLSENAEWQIDSSSMATMQFSAQVQRWNYGVKLYSVTVAGRMSVELAITSTLGFHADYSEVPPALMIEPVIEKANLKLKRFEVDRVSHIGGDVAEAWGDVVQEVILERFVKKQNDKIATKLNAAILKRRDDLRLSWSSVLWSPKTDPLWIQTKWMYGD